VARRLKEVALGKIVELALFAGIIKVAKRSPLRETVTSVGPTWK